MTKWFDKGKAFGNVVFNFRNNPLSELVIYAKAYQESADRLTNIICNSNGYSDFDAYPIFFLYRHATELYLKAIIYKGFNLANIINNTEIDRLEKYFKNHKIDKFIEPLKKLYEINEWSIEYEDDHNYSFKDISKIILELHKLDPNSFKFRYPINKDLTDMMKKHEIINIFDFASIIQKLCLQFDSMFTDMDYRIDTFIEMNEEYLSIMFDS